jgi:hypothetical protein
VLYNLDGPDDGMETVELYNGTAGVIDLSGYSIRAAGTTYAQVRSLTSLGTLMPGRCLSVTGLTGLQNGGSASDAVALFNSAGVIVDAVIYDQPNSNNLADEGGAPGTIDAPNARAGLSLHRVGPRAWTPLQPTPGNCDYITGSLGPAPDGGLP